MAPTTQLSFEDQVDQLRVLVLALPKDKLIAAKLAELLVFARDIPPKFLTDDFLLLLAQRFNHPLPDIRSTLFGSSLLPVIDFEQLVPSTGWLHDYISYTSKTEPPTAFHFFAGATVLGATMARNVSFPRGSGDIYPNVNCVLVAPPGKCKKTTACNLAVNLFRRIGGNVLADKVTPEAIVDSFKSSASATGLIYAPEWAVFLGKQQYMEGLVPMLTALFDCPSVWSSSTILRGTTQLQNVALSHLAATTTDWMQTSITRDAFAGGFMSRLLFVVQKDTPRSFPIPPPLDSAMQKKLIDGLVHIQKIHGKVILSPRAIEWYTLWYESRQRLQVDKHFAGYYERKPDRLLQLAIVLNAALLSPTPLELDVPVLEHASQILTWLEHFMPAVFAELAATVIGDDQARLLKQLRVANGEIGHSEWLRKNTARMNSDMFRKYVDTLKQAKLITYDSTKHRYYLLPAGAEVDV